MGETILIIELLERSISILCTILVDQMIVLITAGWIRKHKIGFTDVAELALSVHTIAWMLFRMPFSSKLLISVINLGLSGLVSKTKSSIVVLILVS